MRALRLAALAALLTMALAPAEARLTAQQLDAVAVAPPPDAHVPLDEVATDIDGRRLSLRDALEGSAAVLVFADYRCTQLCSPILGVAARALQDTGLAPGADFRLLVIGFNPRANADDARQMDDAEIGAPLARAVSILLPPPSASARIARALGFSYAYDEEDVRYAHPASLFVIAPDGRLSDVLSGLAIEPGALRAALVAARAGELGVLTDQVHLLCYGLAASVGRYAGAVQIAIWCSCALTLLGLGGALAYLTRRRAAS